MKRKCIKCQKEYEEEEMVPGKNICWISDNLMNLARKYMISREKDKKYNVSFKRYVSKTQEMIRQGVDTETIISTIADYLPENPKDKESCAYKLYFFCLTQTEPFQSELTPEDWERLHYLYETKICHFSRTFRNGHRQKEKVTQPSFFPGQEKRDVHGKIKPKKLLHRNGKNLI